MVKACLSLPLIRYAVLVTACAYPACYMLNILETVHNGVFQRAVEQFSAATKCRLPYEYRAPLHCRSSVVDETGKSRDS